MPPHCCAGRVGWAATQLGVRCRRLSSTTATQVTSRNVYPTYFTQRFPSEVSEGARGLRAARTLVQDAVHGGAGRCRPRPTTLAPRSTPLRSCRAELSRKIAQGLFQIQMIDKDGVVQEDPR